MTMLLLVFCIGGEKIYNMNELKLINVSKLYKVGSYLSRTYVEAVKNINLEFDMNTPFIFTLAGESGSGKSTLAKLVLGIEKVTSGELIFNSKNIDNMEKQERKNYLKNVQPVFQNPFETFNPLRTVISYLYTTAIKCGNISTPGKKEEAQAIVQTNLDRVGLSYQEVEGKYPHEFSGGQLQRLSIARALIPSPKLLIADEPVSMVDASLRMSIVNLFKDLKDKYGVSIIYITHDLATAYYISDYIAIMLRGQIIERGDVENVLMRPLHPYSQLLKESILQPVPNKRRKGRARKASFEVEEFNLPGCKFTERCSFAEDICRRENPKEYYVEGRTVRCFLYEGEESSP